MAENSSIVAEACAFASITELIAQKARTLRKCSLVRKIIQHVEYPALMARVTKIAEQDTAHLRKQLTPTVTSDAQLS